MVELAMAVVADVLTVPAREFSHPLTFLVEAIRDNRLLHNRKVRPTSIL